MRQPATSWPALGAAAAPVESPKVETTPSQAVKKFSEATEGYLATRISANGGVESADIKSIRRRAEMFITLIGDRPIDAYRHADLQKFVDELQYWPPRPETDKQLRGMTIREILDANKASSHAFGVLYRNTVTGHYVADVQSILKHAAREARLLYPIPELRLILPKIFKAPRKRKAPGMEKMNEVFRLAVERGSLELVVLLWLGMTTGRRIGLLAYLRGCDFRRVGEHVIMQVPEQIADPETRGVERVPNKTEDSRAGFVMHRTVLNSGFCEFAMQMGDEFLFLSRHECVDPADAAQKAINDLLREAEAGGTFHGLRHWHITQMREAGVSEYAQKVQTGHTRGDEHMEYGELPFSPADAALLRDLAMPAEIDFGPLMRLDFSALRR
jgi:integrase